MTRIRCLKARPRARHIAWYNPAGWLLACGALCGCGGLGPSRLGEDQVGYSRALASSEDRETLLNIVRLRYGNAPSFLEATQVISGYQLQRSVSAGFSIFPNQPTGTFLSGGGAAQYQETPTFTFQPVTGEQFAQSFVRPLSPADVLPFALSGMPVDVLFRLGVQSINSLQNTVPLTQSGSVGTPDFFVLLKDLRELQVAGVIGLRVDQVEENDGKPQAAGRAKRVIGRVYLTFVPPQTSSHTAAVDETRRLLGLAPDAREAEIVYGRYAPHPGQIAILTRSMLGVLTQLAFEIDVPAIDVAQGRTLASNTEAKRQRRPVVSIHSGAKPPEDALVATKYRETWFWIADDDFDSKLAFSVVQILLALAKTINPPGTVITIPGR